MMRWLRIQHALGPGDAQAQDLWGGVRLGALARGWVRLVALGCTLPVLAASCGGAEIEYPIVVLDRVAETGVPLSRNTSIALADQNTACVIVSYEVQAHCVERAGAVVGRFGRQGDGPGEFQSMIELVRGPGGVVGLRDSRLARLTVFRPGDGDPLAIFAIPPGLFRPLGPFGDMIAGTYTPISGRDLGEAVRLNPRSLSEALVLGVVDVSSGAIVSEQPMHHPSAFGTETECDVGFSQGARGPDGETAFGTCQSELVFRDASGTMTVIHAPTYVDEAPNRRDIQAYRDGLRGFGGLEPSEVALAVFAETPKKYLILGRSLVYDARGWLWAATQRDRDRLSYLDVYEGTELLGTVRVRDRVVGFDVTGSVLVTLVDRPAPTDAVADRGIDWYDLGRAFDSWGPGR